MKAVKKNNRIWLLTPLAGTLLFVILYVVATLLYPGGSQADKTAKGFSWVNNYWCNLLNEHAINGEINPARPIALASMITLCLTLSFFWFHFPRHINFSKASRLRIQICGIAAMFTALFIFTGSHDIVIDISGVLGLVALIGTFTGLYKNKWYALFWFGIFNLILMLVNNFFYYKTGLLIYLPVIQKITFASYLLWFCMIDIRLYRAS